MQLAGINTRRRERAIAHAARLAEQVAAPAARVELWAVWIDSGKLALVDARISRATRHGIRSQQPEKCCESGFDPAHEFPQQVEPVMTRKARRMCRWPILILMTTGARLVQIFNRGAAVRTERP